MRANFGTNQGELANVDDIAQQAPLLDGEACFALLQLCSTAYLSKGTLSETACATLERANLAIKGRDGYWTTTVKGRALFSHLERRWKRNDRDWRGA